VLYIDVAKVDWDVAYVVMAIHVCFKCFICFRRMLQMFHLDVAKVDLDVAKINRDIAYVVMAIHVCFKCMF
jgi:hypothetical protein